MKVDLDGGMSHTVQSAEVLSNAAFAAFTLWCAVLAL
jgi:hypothetical protein